MLLLLCWWVTCFSKTCEIGEKIEYVNVKILGVEILKIAFSFFGYSAIYLKNDLSAMLKTMI